MTNVFVYRRRRQRLKLQNCDFQALTIKTFLP
jgi:hypothetical protein